MNGHRGDEARRSLQITVHTAVFHKGHGNKGLGFRSFMSIIMIIMIMSIFMVTLLMMTNDTQKRRGLETRFKMIKSI